MNYLIITATISICIIINGFFISKLRQHKPFLELTADEIYDYLDAVNCLQDIQNIADYLSDNWHHYPVNYRRHMESVLKSYSELFLEEK